MLTEIQFFGAEKDLWAHRQSWWRSSGDGLCVCKGKGRGWIPCTSGTLILMAISPLGLVSERVACSNGDATLLRLGIEFWGFMLWGCLWVFYCSVGFLCGLVFWYLLVCFRIFLVILGSAGMRLWSCFLLAAGKRLLQLLTPEQGPYPC